MAISQLDIELSDVKINVYSSGHLGEDRELVCTLPINDITGAIRWYSELPETPTFKDGKHASVVEEGWKMIKEDEESFSQPIPAQIDRYMKKFIDAVQRGNLNRKRKLAILGRTIVALRLEPSEVSKYARLVKREL